MINFVADLRASKDLDSSKKLRGAGSPSHVRKVPKGSSSNGTIISNLNVKELARVMDQCYCMGIFESMQDILKVVGSEAKAIDRGSFNRFIIPFLYRFARIFHRHKDRIRGSRYEKSYVKIVSLYIHRFLGPAPPLSSDNWTRRGVHCSCTDCQWLNRFLAHPEQHSATFESRPPEQCHLINELCKLPFQLAETSTVIKGWSQVLTIKKYKNADNRTKEEWTQKENAIQEELSSLGRETMKDVFGIKSGSELLELLKVIPPTGSARVPFATASPASNKPPHPKSPDQPSNRPKERQSMVTLGST